MVYSPSSLLVLMHTTGMKTFQSLRRGQRRVCKHRRERAHTRRLAALCNTPHVYSTSQFGPSSLPADATAISKPSFLSLFISSVLLTVLDPEFATHSHPQVPRLHVLFNLNLGGYGTADHVPRGLVAITFSISPGSFRPSFNLKLISYASFVVVSTLKMLYFMSADKYVFDLSTNICPRLPLGRCSRYVRVLDAA
jgi:hypothetical protein